MENIIIKTFLEEEAKEVCSWKYPEEYSVYNLPNWNKALELNIGITNELRRNKEFYSLYELDKLIGYFRFIEKDEFLKFGIGLKPDYCGIGYSYKAMPIILNFAKMNYLKKPIMLEVRCFNIRAIRAYKSFGFKELREILNEDVKFLVMVNDSYFI